MKTLEIIVPGRPIAWGRPVRAKGHTFTPSKTLAHERHVGAQAIAAVLRAGETRPYCPNPNLVSVEIDCHFADRRSLPDVDNLAKAVLDGLNKIAWDDDRQVESLTVRRHVGGEEQTRILISSS